ncbi:hypothetical protein AAMO2058_001003000 [Amorphochlora amoebiformis]
MAMRAYARIRKGGGRFGCILFIFVCLWGGGGRNGRLEMGKKFREPKVPKQIRKDYRRKHREIVLGSDKFSSEVKLPKRLSDTASDAEHIPWKEAVAQIRQEGGGVTGGDPTGVSTDPVFGTDFEKEYEAINGPPNTDLMQGESSTQEELEDLQKRMSNFTIGPLDARKYGVAGYISRLCEDAMEYQKKREFGGQKNMLYENITNSNTSLLNILEVCVNKLRQDEKGMILDGKRAWDEDSEFFFSVNLKRYLSRRGIVDENLHTQLLKEFRAGYDRIAGDDEYFWANSKMYLKQRIDFYQIKMNITAPPDDDIDVEMDQAYSELCKLFENTTKALYPVKTVGKRAKRNKRMDNDNRTSAQERRFNDLGWTTKKPPEMIWGKVRGESSDEEAGMRLRIAERVLGKKKDNISELLRSTSSEDSSDRLKLPPMQDRELTKEEELNLLIKHGTLAPLPGTGQNIGVLSKAETEMLKSRVRSEKAAIIRDREKAHAKARNLKFTQKKKRRTKGNL